MKDVVETDYQTSVAVRVAIEDIRPKDIVAVLNQVVEMPSFFWCCSESPTSEDEPIRLRLLPTDPGKPFKITAICLPFVYAKDTNGKTVVFDIRQHQLVRLDSKIGRKVWKKLRQLNKQTSSCTLLDARF